MPNNYFQFKQFTIHQEHSAMKVGTDGVLLGAWAHGEEATHILDIGTGTGLIALMLAQRTHALIDAIELDEAAYREALHNVAQSPWPEKIQVHHTSFQEFAAQAAPNCDLVVCNPPFFKHSLKASSEQRTKARHTDTLTTAELFSGVQGLLAPNGRFEVIIPAENLTEYKQSAAQHLCFLNHLLWIKPTPQKPAKRVLCSFSKTPFPLIDEILVIESGGRHVYSAEYQMLTRDYYLNL